MLILCRAYTKCQPSVLPSPPPPQTICLYLKYLDYQVRNKQCSGVAGIAGTVNYSHFVGVDPPGIHKISSICGCSSQKLPVVCPFVYHSFCSMLYPFGARFIQVKQTPCREALILTSFCEHDYQRVAVPIKVLPQAYLKHRSSSPHLLNGID